MVLAQHAGAETRQLPAIEVQADSAPLAASSGAASKTDAPIAHTAQSITVIERDTMDMLGARNTAEAVRYSAGIGVGGYGADSRVDEISLRGFRSGSFANNAYLDGLRPIGSSSGASAMATQFDGYGLERVEIVRGPASVLYGQIAPGGLINRASKRPQPWAQKELEMATDNHGLVRLNADIGGPLDKEGRWLYRLVGSGYHTGTQVDHVQLNRAMFAPSLLWRMTARSELTVLLNWQQDRGGSTWQFLPADGTYRPTEYGRFGSRRFLGEPSINRYDRTQYAAAWLFSHEFSDALRLEHKLRYMRVDTDNTGANRAGNLQPDGRTLRRSASANQIRGDGVALDNTLQWRAAWGQAQHTVLAGLDWRRQTIRVDQASGTAEPIDVFAPVYGSPIVLGAMQPGQRSNSEQTGLYVQEQMQWRRWIATAALRHDWSRDAALNRATHAGSRYADTAVTGRAGVLYQAGRGISPYLSYASSFEPANGTDWSGAQFKPTEGRQIEAGLKYPLPDARSAITLAAYEIRQKNIRTPDPDPTHLCNGRQCQVQSGEGRVRGLELESQAALTRQLRMLVSATFMRGKVTRSNGPELGKHLPRVPQQSYALFLDYRFAQKTWAGLSVGGGVRHAGRSYGDSANQYPTRALTLLDASLRYDLGQIGWHGMQFSLHASNLADREYVASCSGAASCYYGERRSIAAHLRYRW